MDAQNARKQHAWLRYGLPVAAVVSVVVVLQAISKRKRRRTELPAPSVFLELRNISDNAKDTTWSFGDTQAAGIGRRDSNAVCLQDTGVSGYHCECSYNAGQKVWQLTDLGSTNGTNLNRVQVGSSRGRSEPLTLCTGDKIHLGEHTVLLVTCQPSGPSPAGAQSLGDATAQELLRRLRETPQPAVVTESMQDLQLPHSRMSACSIQRQANKSPHKVKCEDTFSHFAADDGTAVLCIADGHCGAVTSEAIQTLLPDTFAAQRAAHSGANGAASPQSAAGGGTDASSSGGSGLQGALFATFMSIDAEVKGDDGATMTVLLVRGDGGADTGAGGTGMVHLQAANVGDSAVVCADFGRMVKYHLTDNHRVTHPSELARLRDTKAVLTHNETRLMGLNLSRSIGDRALKDLNSGFLAEPYVSKVHSVGPEEELLVVLASDGLWDVTNANLVMRIAYRVLTDHPGDVRLLAQVLLEHALARRSKDDITIVALLVAKAS